MHTLPPKGREQIFMDSSSRVAALRKGRSGALSEEETGPSAGELGQPTKQKIFCSQWKDPLGRGTFSLAR